MTDASTWRQRFPATLERVGRALFGEHWRAALARAMPGPADAAHHRLRILERWFAGTHAPRSVTVLAELADVAEARAAELEAAARTARAEAGRIAREAAAARAAEAAGRPSPPPVGAGAGATAEAPTDKRARA